MSDLKEDALHYHEFPTPGKLSITPTKKMVNQRDLSLAYSPGVAAACEAIDQDATQVNRYTAKSNLVAVITNGTAVLGLGAIGPLAAKPVMEGKAVLFKKFSGIDVFDIEVNEKEVDRFVDIVAALEPTFGGINLEDIKAPECFYIERKLKERLNIPVFHDDQHGTAICVAAAVKNGLRLTGKDIDDVRLVCMGAGSAAIACLDLLVSMGLCRENISLFDSKGLVHDSREASLDPFKKQYMATDQLSDLNGAMTNADIFLGLSGPGTVKKEQIGLMADRPLIFALANPVPEILPEDALAAKPDAIIATGRSDYPNQVNNVLCFPFIFRGALDVGATEINDEMKLACVSAIADLTLAENSDAVSSAYGGKQFTFSREYLIPKPFDPRLMTVIPSRVAKAAMESGVAQRPISDFDAYHRRLNQFVYESGMVMGPIFERAKQDLRRIVYADGEDRRTLSAVQVLVDEGIVRPVLIGRHDVIAKTIKDNGFRLTVNQQFDVVDPQDNTHFERDCIFYQQRLEQQGKIIDPEAIKQAVLEDTTVLACLMVKQGDADGMICGLNDSRKYDEHTQHFEDIIQVVEGQQASSSCSMLILKKGVYFITDPYINHNPGPQQIAENAKLAAAIMQRFGLTPRAALLSHSSFGDSLDASAEKMRTAKELLDREDLNFVVDGEMRGDAALSEQIRRHIAPDSPLEGEANLLVMPNIDAANIALTALTVLGEATAVGPIMMGLQHAAHVLTPSATARSIVNMSAIAAMHSLRIEYEAKTATA